MCELIEEVRKLLIEILSEFCKIQRPAEEVILDDVDLRQMLKVSNEQLRSGERPANHIL